VGLVDTLGEVGGVRELGDCIITASMTSHSVPRAGIFFDLLRETDVSSRAGAGMVRSVDGQKVFQSPEALTRCTSRLGTSFTQSFGGSCVAADG